jgi:hypothetical protein
LPTQPEHRNKTRCRKTRLSGNHGEEDAFCWFTLSRLSGRLVGLEGLQGIDLLPFRGPNQKFSPIVACRLAAIADASC